MDPREKPTIRPGVRQAGDALRAAMRRLPAYVYLDDIFRGRHVLEIGCGDGAGANQLARSGAASVVAVDRSATAIEAARGRYRTANLSFMAGDYDAIDLDDHSVDVVAITVGEELMRTQALLSEARRVLVRGGAIVVAAASGDRAGIPGVPYHDLVGRLTGWFSPVRMIGVTPFVGFSLVEYADALEVLDVELDTSLCELGGGRDPVTDYVAIGGVAGPMPRGYMVIELPAIEGLAAIAAARGSELPAAASAQTPAPPPTAAASPIPVEEEEREAPRAPGEDPELRRRFARAVEERAAAEAEIGTLRSRLAQAEEEIGRVAAQAARELGEARRALVAEAREAERWAQEARRVGAQVKAGAAELEALKLEMAPLEVMVRAAEQHEVEMRTKDQALAERDAYVEELRIELEEVAAAEQAAAAAARDAAVRAAELENEVRELRGRAASAEGEVLRLRARPTVDLTRMAELEAAVVERTAAAEKAGARWKEAEGKSDELWKKIGELQKELSAAREQAVENARAQRQAAQIALTRAVDEASKKLVSSQDLARRTEKERLELERELVALRPRVGALETEVEAHHAAALAAQARLAEAERARTAAEARAAEAEQARAAAEARVAEAQSAAELEQRLAAAEARATEAAHGRDVAEARLGNAEEARAAAEQARAASADGVAEAERARAAAEARLGEIEGALRAAEARAEEAERLRAAAEAQVAHAARERDGLEGRLATLADELRDLRAALAREEQRLGELDAGITAAAAALPATEEPPAETPPEAAT